MKKFVINMYLTFTLAFIYLILEADIIIFFLNVIYAIFRLNFSDFLLYFGLSLATLLIIFILSKFNYLVSKRIYEVKLKNKISYESLLKKLSNSERCKIYTRKGMPYIYIKKPFFFRADQFVFLYDYTKSEYNYDNYISMRKLFHSSARKINKWRQKLVKTDFIFVNKLDERLISDLRTQGTEASSWVRSSYINSKIIATPKALYFVYFKGSLNSPGFALLYKKTIKRIVKLIEEE